MAQGRGDYWVMPKILFAGPPEPCETCGAEHDPGACPFETEDLCPECGETPCECEPGEE